MISLAAEQSQSRSAADISIHWSLPGRIRETRCLSPNSVKTNGENTGHMFHGDLQHFWLLQRIHNPAVIQCQSEGSGARTHTPFHMTRSLSKSAIPLILNNPPSGFWGLNAQLSFFPSFPRQITRKSSSTQPAIPYSPLLVHSNASCPRRNNIHGGAAVSNPAPPASRPLTRPPGRWYLTD